MLVLAMEFSRGIDRAARSRSDGSRRQVASRKGWHCQIFPNWEQCSQKTEQRRARLAGFPAKEVETFYDTECLACRVVSASTGSRRAQCRRRRHCPEQELLRKEVIQPHLPVRLPCYDFTPITDPTFDSSLLKGWATGFGCYRLSWCDGRCVQGPGTYSPRRC